MSLCRNVLRSLGAILVGGALFGGLPSKAEATFTLRLASSGSGGADSVTITDGGMGDAAGAAGQITFIGSIGGFTFNVTVASSNSASATTPAQLQVTNLTATGLANNKLTITLTDDAFTAPGAGGSVQIDTSTSTTSLPSGTLTNRSFLNGSPTSTASVSGPTINASDAVVNLKNLNTNPYTLRSVLTFDLGATGGSFNGTGTTLVDAFGGPIPVPAPAGLVLALTGAPFLIGLRRRMQRA